MEAALVQMGRWSAVLIQTGDMQVAGKFFKNDWNNSSNCFANLICLHHLHMLLHCWDFLLRWHQGGMLGHHDLRQGKCGQCSCPQAYIRVCLSQKSALALFQIADGGCPCPDGKVKCGAEPDWGYTGYWQVLHPLWNDSSNSTLISHCMFATLSKWQYGIVLWLLHWGGMLGHHDLCQGKHGQGL